MSEKFIEETLIAELMKCTRAKKTLMDKLNELTELKYKKIVKKKESLQTNLQNCQSESYLESFRDFQQSVSEFVDNFTKVLPSLFEKEYQHYGSHGTSKSSPYSSEVPKETTSFAHKRQHRASRSQAVKYTASDASGCSLDQLLPPIKVPDSFTGYMLHCESPEDIFVSSTKDLKNYLDLQNDLRSFKNTHLDLAQTCLPCMAVAPWKEGHFRAIVNSYDVTSDSCDVYFVDWGNRDTVKASKLMVLPVRFRVLPPLIRISLTHNENGSRIKERLPKEKKSVKNCIVSTLTLQPIRIKVMERPRNPQEPFEVFASLAKTKECVHTLIASRLKEKMTGARKAPNEPISAVSKAKTNANPATSSKTTANATQNAISNNPVASGSINVRAPERFYKNVASNMDGIAENLDEMSVIPNQTKMEAFLSSKNMGVVEESLPDEDPVVRPGSPVESNFTSISERLERSAYVFNGLNFN